MIPALPVIWREGLLIGPQHLQQADRAAEARLAAALRAIAPLGHGIVRVAVDPSLLASGTFALTALEAVLPDGTPLRCDDALSLPPAVALAQAWPGQSERATVHLALPLPAPDGVAVAAGGVHGGRQVRFRPRQTELPDAAGGLPRTVELAEPNLRLLLDGQDLDGQVRLPIAEVVRSGSDRFALAEDAAPPCLRLDAAPALIACARRIEERLAARVAELTAHRRSRSRGLVEFAVGDVASVLTLQIAAGHLPGLRHAIAAGWPHPADVHAPLAALAGQLLALADQGDPGAVPAYDHQRPATSFAAIEALLAGLLGSVIHTRYVPVPLSPVSERLHAGAIPEQATEGAQLYLAVVSTLPAERVLRDVPLRARVASQGRIDTLVASAMPGIRLTYVAVPPPEIPVQPGGAYFRLEPQGAEFEQAMRARSLAIFLPPELAQARVEFLALKD